MLDAPTAPRSTLRIHDVSDVLSILARYNRWGAYFALLARCDVDVPHDAKRRQRMPVITIDVEG
jgi:hypothetical protein